MNKTCKYHKHMFATEIIFPAIYRNHMEKSHCFLSREPLRCQLPGWHTKYVNTAQLYYTFAEIVIIILEDSGSMSP